MAARHVLNLRTWRDSDYARGAFDADELAQLRQPLAPARAGGAVRAPRRRCGAEIRLATTCHRGHRPKVREVTKTAKTWFVRVVESPSSRSLGTPRGLSETTCYRHTATMKLDAADLIRALADLGHDRRRALVATAEAHRDASRMADPQTARAWASFAALVAATTEGDLPRQEPPAPAVVSVDLTDPPAVRRRSRSRSVDDEEYVDYGGEG